MSAAQGGPRKEIPKMNRHVLASLIMIAGCQGSAPEPPPMEEAALVTDPLITTGPGVPIGPAPMLDPDLVMWSLSSEALGSGQYKLTARLRNCSLCKPYPGGGRLVITRDSPGPIPSDWSGPNTFYYPSSPGLGKELKEIPIPALGQGQQMEVVVNTWGRGIFTAAALKDPYIVDGPAVPELPESNHNNNSKTINMLIAKQITVNTTLLNLALGSTLGATQIRIDDKDGLVKIPGIFTKNFT